MICKTHHPLVCPPFVDKWNVLAKGLNWGKNCHICCKQRCPPQSIAEEKLVILKCPQMWDGITEVMFYY